MRVNDVKRLVVRLKAAGAADTTNSKSHSSARQTKVPDEGPRHGENNTDEVLRYQTTRVGASDELDARTRAVPVRQKKSRAGGRRLRENTSRLRYARLNSIKRRATCQH